VHDLHVWSITSEMPAMSCHIVLQRGVDGAGVLSHLSRLMREKYHIEHTTIQIETEEWVSPPAPANRGRPN
jgi:cobalt-zinc-cadmium efflux system protein